MSLRILHVLDHSIPLHSGYTFRTRAILREQRRRGWETFHLTSPKHSAPSAPEEDVDGLHFYRTLSQPGPLIRAPGLRELALMRATERRLDEIAREIRPDILHAHSPVLNALPALRVGRRLRIPVRRARVGRAIASRAPWNPSPCDVRMPSPRSARGCAPTSLPEVIRRIR